VNEVLHFALFPVPGTKTPARHNSPLEGASPFSGAMHILKKTFPPGVL